MMMASATGRASSTGSGGDFAADIVAAVFQATGIVKGDGRVAAAKRKTEAARARASAPPPRGRDSGGRRRQTGSNRLSNRLSFLLKIQGLFQDLVRRIWLHL